MRRIAHVAVLVEDIGEALAFWQEALGIEVGRVEDSPSGDSKVAFLPLGDGEIELVQPTTRESGLARYLAKHGPGLHHICLEADDIEGVLAQLRERGFRLINQTPEQSAGGRRYAFVHPEAAHGVLVELYEAQG